MRYKQKKEKRICFGFLYTRKSPSGKIVEDLYWHEVTNKGKWKLRMLPWFMWLEGIAEFTFNVKAGLFADEGLGEVLSVIGARWDTEEIRFLSPYPIKKDKGFRDFMRKVAEVTDKSVCCG